MTCRLSRNTLWWPLYLRLYEPWPKGSINHKFGFWILSLVSWRFDALSCSITNANRDLRIVSLINKGRPEFKISPLHFTSISSNLMVDSEFLWNAVLGKMWIYHQYANVLGRLDIEKRQFFTWFYNAANCVYQVYTSRSLSAHLLNNHWTLNTKLYFV